MYLAFLLICVGRTTRTKKAKMANISVKNVTMALTSVVSMSEMALLRMTSKAVLKMVS